MASEIQIKAKKISDIQQLDPENFSIIENGDNSFVLISYKPNRGIGQNYKMSLSDLIQAIGDSTLSDEQFLILLNRNLKQNKIVDFAYSNDANEKFIEKLVSLINDETTGLKEYLIDVLTDSSQSNPDNPNNPDNPSNPDNPDTSDENEDLNSYIFSYAQDINSDIFTLDARGKIINVNVINLKRLSYTQEKIGNVPDNSGEYGTGFCFNDYSKNYSPSFIWDESVENGNIWLIIPEKFFDNTTKEFKDNNGNTWQYIDSLFKAPLDFPFEPIKMYKLYENQNYWLICVSENGCVDEAYFKKLS